MRPRRLTPPVRRTTRRWRTPPAILHGGEAFEGIAVLEEVRGDLGELGEGVEASPAVYIFGAGHVGYYLARMAHEAGFGVHVVDDRAAFANRERFPFAASVVVDDIPAWLERTPLPSTGYAVIVTRGHRNDLEALRALAPRDLRYIGLIGSRAKVARLYDQLLAETSLDPALLERIHAPIGLDLGAVTPQEIAVSITAELIAVRRGKAGALQNASLRWFPKLKALR